jgi:hypothetical protein
MSETYEQWKKRGEKGRSEPMTFSSLEMDEVRIWMEHYIETGHPINDPIYSKVRGYPRREPIKIVETRVGDC